MRLLVAVMLLIVPLSGCTFFGDLIDDLNRPALSVSRTDLGNPNEFGYVTSNVFSVSVLEVGGAEVVITAKGTGTVLTESGLSTADQHVTMDIPDGTWDVSYTVAGYDWETFKNVKIDATAPATDGLEPFGTASQGRYTLGSGYTPEPGTTVNVQNGAGQTIADGLPTQLEGLGDGIHFYIIELRDPAGNIATATVQVAAGNAKLLPEGQHTFGIVARYTNNARLWDISDMDAYDTPAQAASATGGQWLGDGFGVTPDHPEVQEIANNVVASDDTSMEAAYHLFIWLMDNLEYTEERLESDDLLEPDATFANGGGVCRDLAAAYVSLLRASGVPARLVSGYLAGNVNGFHAWVEVYVGSVDGQDPWMPVDVSPIDGRFTVDENGDGVFDGVNTAIQAFGIALPQYLPLRKVPSGETEGWSTALGTSYSYPEGKAPELTFEKELEDLGQPVEGLLCFDPETLHRIIAERTTSCNGMFVIGRDETDPQFRNNNPFVIGTQRVIDYGIEVVQASRDTTMELSLSYPFPADVTPDTVEYVPYSNIPPGYKFSQDDPDPATGKIEATLRR